MKKKWIGILVASFACATANATIIAVTNASNAETLSATVSTGTIALSSYLTSATASTGTFSYEISDLDLNDSGSANDSVTVSIQLASNGGLIYSTANGALGAGDFYITSGESITYTCSDISVYLDGEAEASTAFAATFLGFTDLSHAQLKTGESCIVNGVTYNFGVSNPITFDASQAIVAEGDVGNWRPASTDFSMEVTAIPEPATIGMLGLVSISALFIRRLQMG